ncbi:MAG: polysaccharide biosynthesis C-terminal domain-containing protein [Bacteroidetes bacterium]|nr:polysaccharide biosynthesis C-terminal domain-containing protein [Bacteroidota bacterium]
MSSSNISSLQIFQVIRYGTLIMIGVGLAKLGIIPSDIGRFETFLLWSGLLTFFWVSGIINALMTNYGKSDTEAQNRLFFSTFLVLSAVGVLMGTILFLFSSFVTELAGIQLESSILRLVSIYILFNTPGFLIEYILWLKNKREGLLYYGLLLSFSMMVATLLPVGLNLPIEYSLYGLLAIAVLKFLIVFMLLWRYSLYSIDFKQISILLFTAIPMVLSILISGSSEYIDGLIVKARFDNMHFAIYRYGAKELPVLLIIANTFSTAMIPALAGNLTGGLGQLRQKSTSLMRWFFPLSMLLMLLSPVLFKHLFNESFIYSSLIFNIYLLLVIPRLVFPQTILTAMGHGKYLVVSSILEITINVSLSIYLSGIMGLPGIAAGTLVAFCVDKAFLILVARYKYGIHLSSYLKIWEYALFSGAALVCFAISVYLLQHLG